MTGLAARSVSKSFGVKCALDDVSFDVAPGEIVGLVGENGAGKSTLLKLLAGFLRPDLGRIEVDGVPVFLSGPGTAAALGVGLVHQEFLLIDALTVSENVALGREPRAGFLFDVARAAGDVRACAARFGLDVDPGARVADLGAGAGQRVELLKVLVRGARYLLLDEPTALLPPDGVKGLFAMLRRLAAEGCGVVLVTHRLREVAAVCSRAVVLRGGRVAGARDVARTTAEELARLMVGDDLGLAAAPPRIRAGVTRGGLLSVAGLSVARPAGGAAVESVSFALRAGEILGVAGVAGSGQTELVEAIAGVRPSAALRLSLGDVDLRPLSIGQRRRAGLGYVPEHRGRDGVLAQLTVAENLVLPANRLKRFVTRGWLDAARVRDEGLAAVRDHDVRPPDPDAPAGSLSGGNQQKVLVARELRDPPKVLLAAEPARGLDFRATESVHRRLRALAAAGGAVLLVSADLAELLAVCDRVLVMFAGRIAGEVDPSTTSEDEIGVLMSGAGAR